MAHPNEGLIFFPNEILLKITALVADQDVEARGDILALSATCLLMRIITINHVNEFLSLRSRYRHLVIKGRSRFVLELLHDIQAGKSFHWHVRSLKVKNLRLSWSRHERASGTIEKIREIVQKLEPMTHSAGVGIPWLEKMMDGMETPVLGLLLINLPRIESIEPLYFEDTFIYRLALGGNINGRNSHFWRSSILSTPEPLTVGYNGVEPESQPANRFEPAIIFAGAHHPTSAALNASGSKKRIFADYLAFEEFRTGPQGLRSILLQFPQVTKFRLNCCQHDTSWNLEAVREVLQDCSGDMLEEIAFTRSDLQSRDLWVGSFTSFPILRCLRLDLKMLAGPCDLGSTSLADIVPQSIRQVDVLKIPAEDSFQFEPERLFNDVDLRRFPALRQINLSFNTNLASLLGKRLSDLSNGLMALAFDFSVIEYPNGNATGFKNCLELHESKIDIKLSASERAFHSLIHLRRGSAGK